MSATQQKIAWARRAIAELNKAQSNASRDDFQYHFGAFLALIGALRQFITVDPHKQWVYSMDAADLNYCSCIDLRNVDVHIDNAVGTPRSEFTANIETTLPPCSDSLVAKIIRAGGESQEIGGASDSQGSSKAPGQTNTSLTARFFVNPSKLPKRFAVLPHTGLPRPTKSTEEALLRNTPAVDVAQKALAFFELTVLPGATNHGISIP